MDTFTEPTNENPVDPIDLTIFKEHIKQSLFAILDTLPKVEKTLVLEKNTISKLNYFTTLQPLQERLVRKDLVILKPTPFVTDSPIIIYIVPPKRECVLAIEKQIKANINNFGYAENNNVVSKNKSNQANKNIKEQKENGKEYHIIFIPKINNECQNTIKNSDCRAYFKVHNLNIDIFSLDYDLISLEMPEAFKELYVDENFNCLSLLSRSIIKYETVFGKIKHKYIKGDLSKKLNTILSKEEEISTLDQDSETLACFMFDRKVDMVTPFCSPFTYEGLLDEYIGINFNGIKVSPKLLEKEIKTDVMKVDLSTNDKFYTMIKDFNFNKIRTFLPQRLHNHTKVLEEGKKMTDLKKIQENLDKVKLVKEERNSLTNHINLADYIAQKQKVPVSRLYLQMEQLLLVGGDVPSNFRTFIDDEISKKSDEFSVLRMLCLESAVQSGIKYKVLDQIKREFFNVYGYQEIFLWKNLEKVGVIRNQDNSFPYEDINKKLNLIYENVDLNEPNDASYVYSGYCPIIVRLIEKACSQGWGSIKDVLKKLPGSTDFPNEESEMSNPMSEKQFCLLVFIGGITYGELGAIRYLNKKMRNRKFIVLTTGIINKNRLYDSMRIKEDIYYPRYGVDEAIPGGKNSNLKSPAIGEHYASYKDYAESYKK